jgi:hypothetical protein
MSDAERRSAEAAIAPSFPFAAETRQAESFHLHVKLGDGLSASAESLAAAGWRPTLERPGFTEYRAGPGVSVSFSSIPVAEGEAVEPAGRSRLDHLGFDLTDDARSDFDAIPARAGAAGWAHVGQGGGGTPVHCCFAVAAGKHWVFPPPWEPGPPVEFAVSSPSADSPLMGPDLRPAGPG